MIIAKYKFNHNTYANLLPVFNSEYTSDKYNVSDEVDDTNGWTIRTINSVNDSDLPTRIKFGYRENIANTEASANSLLEVIELKIDNITDATDMFRCCENLASVNTTNWNTSNLIYMTCMFEVCSSLTSLDLSNFNTSKVINMNYMFNKCSSLTSLDLSNWNTSSAIDMSYMFRNCSKLTSLDVSNWNTSNVTNMGYMFNGCSLLTSLDVSNWNTSNVTEMISMFNGCSSLTSLDVSNWNTSNVTNMGYMFRNCSKLTSLDVSNWNTSNVTSISYIFCDCTNLTSLDVSNWDTSKVTNMRDAFTSCNSLTSVDVSNWDTSEVTTMIGTFYNCSSLVSLDVNNWDTSQTTNMNAMFVGCNSLTSLDVSNWDTSEVANMDYMFQNCSSLTSLDISNWNISQVTNMSAIFSGSTKLVNIGMRYCNKDTINKIGTALGTDVARTIWVEDTPISSLTTYNNISYKYYGEDLSVTLTSPLLEGDKLVVRDGKLCHYHKMREIVLDGHEEWALTGSSDLTRINTLAFRLGSIELGNAYGRDGLECDRFIVSYDSTSINPWSNDIESMAGIGGGPYKICIAIKKSKLSTQDVNGFKQWLQANPTKVMYKLVNPYYEVISENPELIAKLASSDMNTVTNNAVVNTNMNVRNRALSVTALKPSTKYTIGFTRDNSNSVGFNLGGNGVTTTDNIVTVTTPSTLANEELRIYGASGTKISDIKLIEGELSAQEMPMSSFKDINSAFESEYISNVNDPNYGKYKVEYKITGKNKFNQKWYVSSSYYVTTNNLGQMVYRENSLLAKTNFVANYKYNTQYTITAKYNGDGINISIDYTDGTDKTVTLLNNSSHIVTLPNKTIKRIYPAHANNDLRTVWDLQIEEGTTATEYEPYREITKTYYLNSPLLEGDTLEEIDGVMNHVHRSGKVVLNGSENYAVWSSTPPEGQFVVWLSNSDNIFVGGEYSTQNGNMRNLISNKFNVGEVQRDTGMIMQYYLSLHLSFPKSLLKSLDANAVKQWLSENPTTVVYQLATPWYEPILDYTPLGNCSNGTLSYESNIPANKVTLQPLSANISYLDPNTTYTLQFNSDNITVFDSITVGGQTIVDSSNPLSVKPGKNKVTFTTGDTVTTDPLLISGKNCKVSDVSIVATTLDYDHFMGLKSTFEDEKIELLDITMDNWIWEETENNIRWQIDGVNVSNNCITIYNNTDKTIRAEINSDKYGINGAYLSMLEISSGNFVVIDNQTKFIRTIQGHQYNGWSSSVVDKAKLANILIAEGDYSNRIEDMLHDGKYKAELVSYNSPIRFGVCGDKQ